ncbi:MAG: DNA-binding protein [Alphaproteobacteria bacterium]|jgi:hypothetical protein|nr:DNA-binding protein [Alphaproteobacteria bacterium]
MKNNQITVSSLMTVKQFVESFPAFSHGSIRGYIFNSKLNGMDEQKVLKRIGKKILIDVDAFFQWIDKKSLEV